ncbi:NAD(P)/FAD-dependent oxidoreductase [Nocardioides rubriscoriae]|uniref:NAD(P)/FAD-dependent oxidoreductase n=1 Tax=Nocardioides rubriscoriae TaxID=642762 RepID=UPI0011DFECC6|nr:FAD-dependent oxidoreductase [Nocardioides rubriscoriae]
MRTRVLVLGANFGGMTAALGVKNDLGAQVDVVVVTPDDHFVFTPSLVWLPFGRRHRDDLTFPVRPTLESHGIELVKAAAVAVDPVGHQVTLDSGRVLDFDYLVVATGTRPDDVVPGVAEHACTITDLAGAERCATAWRRLLREPGDVVVAATQGSTCFGAAYEFLLDTAYHLDRAGLRHQVRLTFVTPEPYVGHLGPGGPGGPGAPGVAAWDPVPLERFLDRAGIETRTAAAIDHVDRDAVVLDDGEALRFTFSMVVPPFAGQDFLREADGLSDDHGLVLVRDTFQSEKYDDVYAVGAAAAVDAPWQEPVPAGPRRHGLPTEVMAQTAALNIASQVRGASPTTSLPFADTTTTWRTGPDGPDGPDPAPGPRRHGAHVPGARLHRLRVGFERYSLWKMRHGHVNLV